METTMIDAAKTVSEIQATLGRYGASAILTEYEDGDVSAVSFQVKVNGQSVPFRLPCRWQSIFKFLVGEEFHPVKHKDFIKSIPQSKRVAWRQILRWVQAQLALTETDMVSIQEVFLPYLQTGVNQTLYQAVEQKGFKFKQLEHKP